MLSHSTETPLYKEKIHLSLSCWILLIYYLAGRIVIKNFGKQDSSVPIYLEKTTVLKQNKKKEGTQLGTHLWQEAELQFSLGHTPYHKSIKKSKNACTHTWSVKLMVTAFLHKGVFQLDQGANLLQIQG